MTEHVPCPRCAQWMVRPKHTLCTLCAGCKAVPAAMAVEYVMNEALMGPAQCAELREAHADAIAAEDDAQLEQEAAVQEPKELLTHRCPSCAGTSIARVDSTMLRWVKPEEDVPCTVCTQYGPFGLVPEIVAIEQSLAGPCEREQAMRNNHRRQHGHLSDVLAWLLEDAPAPHKK